MNRRTIRYALVALGAGLISLASCGGQSTENQTLPSRRQYTPEERAKIEHTRKLMDRYLPGWKIDVPDIELNEAYLKLADTTILKLHQRLQEDRLFQNSIFSK